jgi:hypothetical protein
MQPEHSSLALTESAPPPHFRAFASSPLSCFRSADVIGSAQVSGLALAGSRVAAGVTRRRSARSVCGPGLARRSVL